MTMTPKAESTASAAKQAGPSAAPEKTGADEEAQTDAISEKQKRGQERAARRAARQAQKDAPEPPENAYSAIQIRTARRVAIRHGIEATDDAGLIEVLQEKGIDPFARSSLIDLVGGRDVAPESVPQVVYVPAEKASPADVATRHNGEIMDIRRDIARRRRMKLAMLFLRLAVFILLPTAVAGYYFYRVATPLYATEAEFLVQKSGGSAGGLGALFSGTALGSSQEAVAVQRYLTSIEAVERLDREHGYKSLFSDPDIDFIQRLPADASLEAMHKHYKRHVKVGYDPTEGVVRMKVIAVTPEASVAYSEALVAYAEEVVDNLSARQRSDQVAGARASFEDARQAMLDAQVHVLELQEARGVLSAEAEAGTMMTQLAGFQTQLHQEQMRLDTLMQNVAPPAAKVAVVEANIERLKGTIAGIRGQMTASASDSDSLARIAGELLVAEADLQSRQLLLQQALQQLETARTDASRQVGYLALNVAPVLPEAASFPRSMQNTLLAFLIFAGIYLALSVTASVLKEQVSA